MVEAVDTEPATLPALPILASHLLDHEERKGKVFTDESGERISTRNVELDKILGGGGLERGIVVGISHADENGGVDGHMISLQTLCSCVLSSPKANALILTTIHSQFPIEIMINVLKQLLDVQHAHESPAQLTARLDEIMTHRIAVAKVYDLEELCQVWGGEVGDEATQIVVMDSLVPYMSDRLSNAPDNTKPLLQELSKLIRSRSREQNILTIMHNGTTDTKSKDSLTSTSTSVFSDNPIRPKFGQFFDQFTDLHLLISRIETSIIVEIIKDETPNIGEGQKDRKFASREQTWTPL